MPGTQAPGSTPPPLTPPPATLVARVRLALGGRTDDLATGILAALSTAADNDEKAIDAIQKWYDAAMDRVSGWYKRETQHILFWLGLALAVGMNVDTIYLAKFLAADTGARQHLAQTVEQAYNEGKIPNPALIGAPGTAASDAAAAQASDSAAAANGATAASSDLKDTEAAIKATDVRVSEAIHRVIDLNLPIGWTPIRRDEFFDSHNVLNSLSTILGWLVTAFGLSVRRAVLVRRAQQGHGDPLDGEAAREESRRSFAGPPEVRVSTQERTRRSTHRPVGKDGA